MHSIFDGSILPESPRWLVSKQRYEDAEILLRHIAERNKKEFNAAKYERFVQEDKKVCQSITSTHMYSFNSIERCR